MKQLICLAAITALAMARPELYKEKEDFQFSRSSSDDGTKSGYYDAQRGNMGGNYEKSHNMDGLAQHQMSGLVSQVEGELGEGAETKTGSVYTSANSQGIYGAGRYDLSNLRGRNFQEGVSLGDSRSHSSLSSHNAGYRGLSSSQSSGYTNSHSQNSGYAGYGHTGSDQIIAADNLQTLDSNFGSGQTSHATGYNSGYRSQSGYQGQSTYDASSNLHSSNSFGSNGNVKSHLISTRPVRISVRPGSTVAVPVGVQTYDTSNSASLYNQNSINSNAELLTTAEQIKPANHAKHYESSYNYRKEWEKQDSKPIAAPLSVLVVPVPQRSELYEDSLAHGSQFDASRLESQNQQLGQFNSGYNANVKSTSSINSHQKADFNAQHQSAYSGLNSNAYMQSGYNTAGNLGSSQLVADVTSKPKSYQSSYSYHKSWERQGDPYVIKPGSEALFTNQASQNLVSNSHQSYSQQHGAQHSGYAQGVTGVDCDCDDAGQIRVARSIKPEDHEAQEDLGQQTQGHWENLEDLGQQTQTNWGQHTGSARLEDLGQQAQTHHSHGENGRLEDLGQRTQKHWDFQHQHGSANLEDLGHNQDLGHETQKHWGNYRPHDNNQQMMESPKKPWFKEEKQGTLHDANLEKSEHHAWAAYSKHVYNGDSNGLFRHDVDESQNQIGGNWDQQFEDNTQQVLQNPWTAYHTDNQYENQETQSYITHHWPSNDSTNFFKLNTDTQTNKPILSLWDKINTFEKDSSMSNFNQESYLGHRSDEFSNHYGTNYGTDANRDVKITTTPNPTPISIQNTAVFKNPNNPWFPITTSTTEKNKHPSDVGRGDIGPEDLLPISTTTDEYITVNKKPYKTPEEIEALSLIKSNSNEGNDTQSENKNNIEKPKTEANLSVISLHEQGITNNKTSVSQNNDNGDDYLLPDYKEHQHNTIKLNKTLNFDKVLQHVPEKSYQSELNQQSNDFEKDDINLEQQQQQNWDEQQLEGFGQQSAWNFNENLEQRADNNQELQSFNLMFDKHKQNQYSSQQYSDRKPNDNFDHTDNKQDHSFDDLLNKHEQQKEYFDNTEKVVSQQPFWNPNVNFEQQAGDYQELQSFALTDNQLDHNQEEQVQRNLDLNEQYSAWKPNNDFDQHVDNNQELNSFDLFHKHDEKKKRIDQNENTEQEVVSHQESNWDPKTNLEQQADSDQETQNFADLVDNHKHGQNKDDFCVQSHNVERNGTTAQDLNEQHFVIQGESLEQSDMTQETQNFAALSNGNNFHKDVFYEQQIIHKNDPNNFFNQQQSKSNLNEYPENQADNGQKEQVFESKADQYNPHKEFQDTIQDDKEVLSIGKNSLQKQNATEIVNPDAVTENPGFWKSVGKKFKSAKDNVSSWFSSG